MRRTTLITLLAGVLVLAAWLAFFWWHRRNLDAAMGVLVVAWAG